MNLTHLDALRIWLSHERVRLSEAKSDKEKELRAVWVAQIEKEIADEMKFLGIFKVSDELKKMTDEEILSELGLDI